MTNESQAANPRAGGGGGSGETGVRRMKIQYGYFMARDQEIPAYDPGLNVPCPICAKLISPPVKTISIALDGDDQSYFYRTHKACYEGLTEEEQTKLDSLIIDARAMSLITKKES